MFVVTAFALLASSGAFNLDMKHCTIFKDPEDQLGSYFGYTVSLLKEAHEEGGSWLLAGAPRGNSTYPKQSHINQPGVVYQCKLSDKYDSCKSLVLDSKGESERALHRYSFQDKKELALLGSALDTQSGESGRIVVCGPRWRNRKYEQEPMNGVCYYLNGSKTFDSDAEEMVPLVDRSLQVITFENSDKMNSDPPEILFYIYGGAGFSVNFVKNSTDMIIGAPGVFEWTGTIIRLRNKFPHFPTNTFYTDQFIPNPSRTESLGENSYFGYSVESGRFVNSTKTYYVGGAPKAGDLKGKVFIFDFPKSQEDALIIKMEIEGNQMGEYFGSCICVVDLNADGLDDIVVGAPQHSIRSTSAFSEFGDEGKVYVFINADNWMIQEAEPNEEIMGGRQQGARFGTAVSNLGDLNSDGYSDIAVGAPYENFGHGVVYIYHGNSGGINPKFVQRIAALEIDHSILGFGFSISRGSDTDNNQYPDIAVGAYESGHAVVFKSHPVINFNVSLISNVRRLHFNATGFITKACILYTGRNVPESVVAAVNLEVDQVYGRAHFILDSELKRLHHYEIKLSYKIDNCDTFHVQISTDYQDFSKPITLRMEYQLLQARELKIKKRKKRENIGNFCKSCPVVDPSAKSHIDYSIPYITGCEDNDICRTDVKTEVNLKNIKTHLVIGSIDVIFMEIMVKNFGEPAFLSHTNITMPKVIPLIRIPKNCIETSMPIQTGNYYLNCEMGNPLRTNQTYALNLEFDARSIPPGTVELIFNVSSGSSGEDIEPSDDSKEIIVPLRTISDMSISGKANPERFYLVKMNDTYADKILSFSHLYEIRNLGPSPVNKINLTFSVPVIVEGSTGLIHFVQVHQPQVNFNAQPILCAAKGFEFYADNNHYHETNASSDSERFSELEERKQDELNKKINNVINPATDSSKDDKIFEVSCSTLGIQCMFVECIIGPFKKTQTRAIINFPLKIHPEALEPLLKNKDAVIVSSSGNVEVLDFPQPMLPDHPKPDFIDVKTRIEKLNETQMAAWVIAVAIFGGLLLLLLITLGLIKMGFFKRHKKEELERAKGTNEMKQDLTTHMETE